MINVSGAITVTLGLVGLIYAMVSVENGSVPRTLSALALSVLLLGCFLANQSRSCAPLIPRRLSTDTTVLIGSAALLLATGADGGVVYLMPLYLQRALGYSPLQTGLVFLAPGLAAVLASARVAPIVARWGLRRTLLAGLCVEGSGMLVLFAVPAQQNLGLVLAGNALDASGTVIAIVASTILVVGRASSHEQGALGGVLNTAIQLGTTLGIAGLVAAAATTTHLALGSGSARDLQQTVWLTASLHRGMAAGSIFVLLAVGAGWLATRRCATAVGTSRRHPRAG